METVTISEESIQRLSSIDQNEKSIEFDDLILKEKDDYGENYGLSFKAVQSVEYDEDFGDYWTPPSSEITEHQIYITEIKIIDSWSNSVEISKEKYSEVETNLIQILKNQ